MTKYKSLAAKIWVFASEMCIFMWFLSLLAEDAEANSIIFWKDVCVFESAITWLCGVLP